MACAQTHRLERVAAIQASLAAAAELESETAAPEQEVDDGENVEPVIEIERLLTLGITQADVTRLKNAGMVSVAGVKMTSKKVRRYFPFYSVTSSGCLLTATSDSHGDQRDHGTKG